MKKIIGALLVSSPFVGLFVEFAMEKGFWNAVAIYLIVLGIVAAIAVGVALIKDDL